MGEAMTRDSLISFMAVDKAGKCVSEETEVVLSDGRLRTIKELVDNKEPCSVLSLDVDSLRLHSSSVSMFWCNGEKKCWKVVTKSGREIITTGNHLYRTPHDWTPLEKLKVGDFVAVPRLIPVFGDKEIPESRVLTPDPSS